MTSKLKQYKIWLLDGMILASALRAISGLYALSRLIAKHPRFTKLKRRTHEYCPEYCNETKP